MNRESEISIEISRFLEETKRIDTTPDKKMCLLKEFLQNNSISSIEKLKNIDPCDFFTAYLSTTTDIDLEIIEKAIEDMRPIIERLRSVQVNLLFLKVISTFDKCNIRKLNNKKGLLEKLNILKEPEKVDFDLKKSMIAIGLPSIDPKNLHAFLSLLEERSQLKEKCQKMTKEEYAEYVSPIIMAIQLVVNSKQIKENKTLESSKFFSRLYSNAETLLNADDAAIIKSQISSIFLSKESFIWYYETFKYLMTTYENKENEIKKKERQKNKDLKFGMELLSYLNSIDENHEITDIEKYLSKISSEELKLKVLKYVYIHNQRINKGLEKEYKTLSKSSSIEFYKLFASYKLSVDEAYLSQLDYSPEDLALSLEKLKYIGITASSQVLAILLHSTKDAISTIANLYDRKILSQEELVSYPTIFIPTSDSYKNTLLNIKTFTNYELNPRYLGKSPKTLLSSNENLSKNLANLKEKDYLDSIDRETNIDFMSKENLGETLELINKLGHSETVKDDIDLLNIQDNRWKRIIILQVIGEEPEGEDIRDILMSETFFIPDEKLDDYIFDSTLLEITSNNSAVEYVKTTKKQQ